MFVTKANTAAIYSSPLRPISVYVVYSHMRPCHSRPKLVVVVPEFARELLVWTERKPLFDQFQRLESGIALEYPVVLSNYIYRLCM